MKACPQLDRPQPQNTYSFSTLISFGVCCLLGLLLARSVDDIIFEGISVDMPRYYRWYASALAWPLGDYITFMRFEPGYSVVTWILANLNISFDTFVIANKILLALSYCYFVKKIVSSNFIMVIFSSILIVSPLFSGYTENLVRQGAAYSFFLIAYARLLDGNKKQFIVLALLAAMMHFSSILWSLIALATSYPIVYRRFKLIALSVLAVAVLYVLDVPLRLSPHIQALGNLVGIGYVNIGGRLGPDAYVIGFKTKFMLASLVLFAGCAAIFFLRAATDMVRKIMALSLLLTAAYMLCSGFAFYDRLASVSWSFIPAVWGAVAAAMLRAMGRRSSPQGPSLRRAPIGGQFAGPGLDSPRRPLAGQAAHPRPLRYR